MNEVLRLTKHGVEVSLFNQPGRQARCWYDEGKFYEEGLLEAMYEYTPQLRGRTFLDVGASIGNHTLWFSKVMGMRGHAFEPESPEYQALVANLTLNNVHLNVMVHRSVVGGPGHDWAQREGRNTYRGFNGTGTLPILRIDELAPHDVGLVKIDVEGMELDVLEGARDTLDRCRPIVLTECEDPDAYSLQSAALEPLGFREVRRHNVRRGVKPVVEWQAPSR